MRATDFRNRMWRGGLCLLLLFLCAACWGCGGSDGGAAEDAEGVGDPVSREFFAMDTYMTVTAYGERADEAVEAAEAEVKRLDGMLSTGDPNSEISRLNSQGRAELSEETGDLVKRGQQLYLETDRCFDIAIYPITEAWGFSDKNYRVPSKEEIGELLPLTDPRDVEVRSSGEGAEISFAKDGMSIDLGGIAKGYTSSRIMEIYRDMGITSGLVSLGGNVQVLGTRPDGNDWRVAVQDPGGDENGEMKYLGVLEAADTAIITSGGYERYFTQDGVVYHHIIDPSTGYPADSGLRSVTIVCQSGAVADALSTSLFIMGKEKAIGYWREHASDFDFVLMDDDGELYVTEPIAHRFSSDEYHVTVVK